MSKSNIGFVVPENALEKMRELGAVDQMFARATHLTVVEGRVQEGQEVLEQAENMAAEYYQKYPNCLSRRTHPWAQ